MGVRVTMENVFPDIVTDPVHESSCIKCGHLMDVSNLPAFVQIACPECGMQQRVPGKMGSFLLVDLLGKGGMGAVYRGRDTGLDRWVAVKVMQSSFGGNPAFVETFRREAQAAAALNHPNIVQIYSFGVAHGQPFMAMELLEGGRLDQMIAKGEFLNEAMVLKIGADVAEGLGAAANINLIHGDVKPENILLDNNGIAKVVDFGLARFKEQSEGGGTSKGIWGTPYYIAPEKLRGHPSDARSDIYSLGGTLFHALALKPPFDGETPMDVVKARLKHAAPILRSVRSGINHEVEAIVGRMLDADPGRRYPNYPSVLSDIRRVLPQLNPPTMPAFGAPGKKGGKIILSKKKSVSASVSAPVPPPTSSQHMSTRISRQVSANLSGSLSGKIKIPAATPVAAASPAGEAPKGSSKLVRTIVLGVLALCAIAGSVAGFIAYRHSSAQRSVAEQEKKQLTGYRKNADTIWNDVQAAMAEVSNRDVIARGWASNATATVAAITAGVGQLPEAGDAVALGTNAAACAAVVDRYLSDSIAPAVLELRTLAEGVGSNRQAMLLLTNPVPAALHVAAITNVPARVEALRKSLFEPEETSRKAMETLAELNKKLDSVRKAASAAAEKAAAEKAEADKVAAAAAAAEQAAAEKTAKAQAELAQLGEARKAVVPQVQQHQFKQAVESLEQVVRGMKTDAGKSAGKEILKAYQRLAEMKTLFVDGIHAEAKANPDKGFSYGWMKQADILGATEEKVILRGGQMIAWSAVPPKQMMIFVQHYVVDNPDLTARERAGHQFAVALYIYDTASSNENARKMAARYLADALKGSSSLEEQAKVLMPDLDTK